MFGDSPSLSLARSRRSNHPMRVHNAGLTILEHRYFGQHRRDCPRVYFLSPDLVQVIESQMSHCPITTKKVRGLLTTGQYRSPTCTLQVLRRTRAKSTPPPYPPIRCVVDTDRVVLLNLHLLVPSQFDMHTPIFMLAARLPAGMRWCRLDRRRGKWFPGIRNVFCSSTRT